MAASASTPDLPRCGCNVSGEPWAEVGDVSIAGQKRTQLSSPGCAEVAVSRQQRHAMLHRDLPFQH